MKIICDHCKTIIPSNQINVEKDTAYCPSCENLSSLSTLLSKPTTPAFDPDFTEDGTWHEDTEQYWLVGASHRSYTALFIIPFTIAWSWLSLSGIYGSQVSRGEFDLAKSLFGLPFLFASIALILISLMLVFGQTIVYVENNSATLFSGIGTKGWYRYFNWDEIHSISEIFSPAKSTNAVTNSYLSLEGNRRINLGWGLSAKRKYYLLQFLRSKISH